MFSEWFFGFGAVLWLRIGFVVSELFCGFGVVSEWYWSGFGVILEWFWSGFGLFLEPGFGAWFSGLVVNCAVSIFIQTKKLLCQTFS